MSTYIQNVWWVSFVLENSVRAGCLDAELSVHPGLNLVQLLQDGDAIPQIIDLKLSPATVYRVHLGSGDADVVFFILVGIRLDVFLRYSLGRRHV